MLTEVWEPVRHRMECCGLTVRPSVRATCPDKEREGELRGTAHSERLRHGACDMFSR